MVSFMHEHNIICSQTQVDDVGQEQTIIYRQLFESHVVGSWPLKGEKNALSDNCPRRDFTQKAKS